MSAISAATAAGLLPLVTVRYADLVMRFESPDGSVAFRVPPEYQEFVVGNETEPVGRVLWRLGKVSAPRTAPTLGGEVWDFRGDAEGGTLTFYRGLDRTPYAEAVFDMRSRLVHVVQDAEALGSDVADIGIYPLTEILATRFLGHVDAVDLHASAAAFEGGAYLFMGHSGAGKTTISEIAIAEGATVLSDDRTIVGVRDGVPIAWGTPWHGSGRRSSSRTAPIAGIFLLVQAAEERVVRLGAARAYKEMFVRLIHQRLSREETESALATLERLVAVAPVWELHFRPVPAAFRLAVETARMVRPGRA
jgi:hypothetical protein